MKHSFFTIIICLFVSNAWAVSSPKLRCTNPGIEAIKATATKFVFASELQSKERVKSLLEIGSIRSRAEWLAIICSFIFGLNLAVLLGILSWKTFNLPWINGDKSGRSKSMNLLLSLYATQLYLFVFFLGVYITKNQNDASLVTFKKTLRLSEIPEFDLRSNFTVYKVPGLLINLAQEMDEIPKRYWGFMNSGGKPYRWWTLGWDHVALTEYEYETALAIAQRFSEQAKKVQKVLPQIDKFCHSPMEI